MTPGSYIAIGALSLFAGLVAYGVGCDIHAWLEERAWRRDERHARARLERERNRAGYRPLQGPELQEAARQLAQRIEESVTAARRRWFEGTAQEIASLPEIEPQRRLA